MLKCLILRFWPLIFIVSAVFVFFVRLIYPQLSVFVTPDFGTSDLLNFNYPFRDFLSQSLKNGQLPLWISSVGSGFPFFAESQAGAFFLPNIVASLLPNIALNMFFSYLIYFLPMVIFTYFFCRELNLGKWESLLAALVFTFSGVNLTHISHPNQLAVVSMLPLQFFLLEKFIKGQTLCRDKGSDPMLDPKGSSWLALFSLVTAQSIFAGYLQPAVYAILALGVYFCLRLFLIIRPRPASWRGEAFQGLGTTPQVSVNLGGFLLAWLRPATLFVFSLVLAVGLSAIQFLPSWELSQQSSRQGGLPESILKLYPYPPKNLLTFLNPNWFGIPRDGSYPMFSEDWGIYWENSGYVGLIPLGLALFVIIAIFLWLVSFLPPKFKIQNSKFKITIQNLKLKIQDLTNGDDRATIAIFTILLIVTLLLTLGKYTPLFALYHRPPLSYFRVPSRWLIIVDFSLAILAALGLKILRSLRKRSDLPSSRLRRLGLRVEGRTSQDVVGRRVWFVRLLPFGICLLSLFDLWFYFFNFNPIGSYQKWIQTPPQIVEFLKNLPADGAGQGSGIRYYEVGSTIAWNTTFVDRGWQNNLESFWKLREGSRPSNNILYNLSSAGIYAGLLPQRQSDLINLTDALFVAQPDGGLAVTNAAVKLLAIQNVKYVVSPFSLLHPDLKPLVTTRFSQPDVNFIVYENLKVLPRVYLVNHYRLNLVGDKVSNDLDLIKQGLVAANFDPQESVILEEDPKFKRQGSLDTSIIRFIEVEDQKIVLNVDIPNGNGLLVLTDSYYPGWIAKVDGKETKILAANLNQRAIAISQGEHNVEFIYQPQSFRLGVTISIISLMILAGWLIFSFRVAKRL